MAGGTSPYPIAGTLVLQIAENMFLLAAKHALDPDLPALLGGAPASLDMRTAEVAYGAVERRLMMLALLDVFRPWGIPAFSPANSVDSCLCDVQIGAEKTWTYLCSELSDACAGTGIGAVTNGKTVSLEQMLIDRDLICCARRFSKGIDTGEAARSVDALLRVPHGGSFLTDEGTISRLRGGLEYYEPDLFNRGGPDGRALLDRAHDRVEEVLDGCGPPLGGTRKVRLDAYIDAQKGKTDHEA
jgi:trimethylamine:corrinoid methyltransferase-like protein